ncbi:hypothetical protein [Salinivibrio kushneri]|uniref:hypothetical protein n=1 Tax=Salinivibrio kushneri TaxID=1908198 RepID=UPI0009894E1B|nr:hypothetical protein [Salinivibrio kushneri]OOE70455.1 hypothetical protein BZG19_05990 [Salinivibrio kushneri]
MISRVLEYKNKVIVGLLCMGAVILVSWWSTSPSGNVNNTFATHTIERDQLFKSYSLPSNAPGNLFVEGRGRSSAETAKVDAPQKERNEPLNLVSIISTNAQQQAVFIQGNSKITVSEGERINDEQTVNKITPTRVQVIDTMERTKDFILFPTQNIQLKGQDDE